MALFTKFLKLLKPEQNDYVDVKAHIADNYDIIDAEMEKKATKDQLGRLILGENLTYNETTGKVDGAPPVDISGKQDKTDNNLETNSKEVVGAINEIVQKLKNFCPYEVGDILTTTSSENPATRWLGTTWEKLEGRVLLGSSNNYALGSTGGSASVTLTYNNMPSHRHKVESTSTTTPAHNHTFKGRSDATEGSVNGTTQPGGGDPKYGWEFTATTDWGGGGNTGSFAPYTDYQGSGQSFNILPPYLVVNIWKRLT